MISSRSPISDRLEKIAATYWLASGALPPGHKSRHWDVFPDHYDRAFGAIDAWPKMLRNAVTVGFNDDISGFVAGGNLGPSQTEQTLWSLRERHDYKDLLPETLTEADHTETVAKVAGLITAICGRDFTLDNLAPAAGSPSCAVVGGNRLNLHDLPLIYHLWQINRAAADALSGRPTIVEIGAGHGGLAAKLKDLHPAARVILLDLPEVNAVQSYYLSERFPDARIIDYGDIETGGVSPMDRDFDFAILPGWMIDQLEDGSVDLAINLRSMMEMNAEIIEFYFRHIQRTVRSGGLFSCINRYVKGPPISRIKDYPFDDLWSLRLSQTSLLQNHIHELIVERTETAPAFPAAQAIRSLPPID
ncbi:MAG: putative sugar O-methyltransferase [Proteobacteria bacterium]|nr:putative sugar O-methyltransferase [Pseudomonadota bacterium]